GAGEGSLEEWGEHSAPAGDVAAPHHDRAEHPWNLLGHEIDENVDALLARQARERLVKRRRFDLTRLYRVEAVQAAAIFLQRHVVAGEAEPRQRERDGGIALRAERAHAAHAALELGRGLHSGRGGAGE